MDGLLIFAHGARDPAWAAPFQAIAAELQARRPDLPIALAYLELMTPDIATAAGALAARGCQRIQVVPMFLGASGHVRRDVPPLIEALRAGRLGGVAMDIHYQEPVADDDELLSFGNVVLTPRMAGSPRHNGLKDFEQLITGLAREIRL